MNDWRVVEKPLPSADGLTHVDDQNNVWQWNLSAGMAAWTKRPEWYLEEVGQIRIPLFPISLIQYPFQKTRSVYMNEWNERYSKAFYIFEFLPEEGASVIQYYKSWMRKSAAEAFVQDVAPRNTGHYLGILTIRIFQVVDPTIKCFRTGHSNILYSKLRGNHAHNRNSGRESGGLHAQFELDAGIQNTRWNDTWHVDTAKKFINAFFGITTAPAGISPGNKIFNFAHTARNFYRQCKSGTGIDLQDRWWYNVGANAYQDYLGLGTVSPSIGIPKFFGWRAGQPGRELVNMTALKGGEFFAKSWRGVTVYPLTALEGGQQLRSFLIKPYGMDSVGLGYDRTLANNPDWQIVAENVYPDSFCRVRKTVTAGVWNIEDTDLTTFPISSAIRIRGGGANYRIEHNGIPEKVYFFLQNGRTGVRSELFKSSIQVVRRRNNMSVCVLPSYK